MMCGTGFLFANSTTGLSIEDCFRLERLIRLLFQTWCPINVRQSGGLPNSKINQFYCRTGFNLARRKTLWRGIAGTCSNDNLIQCRLKWSWAGKIYTLAFLLGPNCWNGILFLFGYRSMALSSIPTPLRSSGSRFRHSSITLGDDYLMPTKFFPFRWQSAWGCDTILSQMKQLDVLASQTTLWIYPGVHFVNPRNVYQTTTHLKFKH